MSPKADRTTRCWKADLADAALLTRELEACDAAPFDDVGRRRVCAMRPATGTYIRALGPRCRCGTRIVYLGGLGETGSSLSEQLSSRRDVEGALASTRVPVTVLRAAMIIGSASARPNGLARCLRPARSPAPRRLDSRIEPGNQAQSILRQTGLFHPRGLPGISPHSSRSAVTGLIRIARRAGIQHASAAMASIIASTIPSDSGSLGWTP
jgi:hypothetical protein